MQYLFCVLREMPVLPHVREVRAQVMQKFSACILLGWRIMVPLRDPIVAKEPQPRRVSKLVVWVALMLGGLALILPVLSDRTHIGRRLCMAFGSIDATNCLLLSDTTNRTLPLQASPQ